MKNQISKSKSIIFSNNLNTNLRNIKSFWTSLGLAQFIIFTAVAHNINI